MNIPLYGIVAFNDYIKDVQNMEDANASSKFPAIAFVHEYGDKKDVLFQTNNVGLYDLGDGWKLSKMTITRNPEPILGNYYIAYVIDANGDTAEFNGVADAAWQNDAKMIKKSLQWVVDRVPKYSSAFSLERLEKLNHLYGLASFHCEEIDCTDEINEFVNTFKSYYIEMSKNHKAYAGLNAGEFSSLASLGYAAVNLLTGEN